ncbi:PilZ domain-containing protein [uncultured Parasphingorhabdus sp.]|uniref:PilZ domain-containing protein n=1 Tax=uncultured Parasphingorhabdus sp. TaxID=2709694 RepID=UPI0030DAE504|tara:strand:- start:53387 stop:53797 length:411 start_codon:yes stop_codon:yes gene_type:complete
MKETFDDSLKMNSQAVDYPKRQLDRDSLFLKAELRFIDGDDCGEVRIRNLSAGGLMAEAPVLAKRGDKVQIELRNIGRITGYVAWVAQGRFGVAFDHPIDPKLARKPVGQKKQDLPQYLRQQSSKSIPLRHGQRPR